MSSRTQIRAILLPLILFLAEVQLSGCSGSPPDLEALSKDYVRYRTFVPRVVTENRIETWLRDDQDIPFFHDLRVIALYQNAPRLQAVAWQLLRDRATSLNVRKYQAKLLQCLSLESQLELLTQADNALRASQVEPEVVSELIVPGAEWGTTLALAYKQPRVQELLQRIATNPNATPNLRTSVDEVRAGRIAAYILAYNVPNERLPRLSCGR